jgi:tripeptidyl-peptidase-2
VDPAAFGLNGKGKIVDIIDCTGANGLVHSDLIRKLRHVAIGSGDIPLKTVEAIKDSDATTSKDQADAIRLPGISGRTLLVSSKWANPTNKWKVGFKRAYDLWPGDLVKRRKLERKAAWDVKVSTLLSSAKKELNDHEKAVKEAAKQDKPEKNEKADQKAPSDKKATEPTKEDKEKEDKELEQKAKKLDLEAKVSYLNDFSLDDPGPILDVVVFHDGESSLIASKIID